MIQSSKAIIKVRNLSKRYPNNCISLFWNRVFNSKVEGSLILNNLTFDISKGTCLGVLGTNGAGKSTYCNFNRYTYSYDGKSGNKRQSCSNFRVRKWIRRLFYREENVELYSHVMGYSSSELDDCIHKIKDFAELGEYYYKPIKTYSSGMIARLAFSVRVFKFRYFDY